jgi:hypothetical protein
MSDMDTRFYAGLDIGQSADHTALVALERTPLPPAERSGKRRYRYEVRGVKRWPLRTLYCDIAMEVAALVRKPPLCGCVLGVDKTGVGAGVLEIIRAAKPKAVIRPILITSGHEVIPDGAGFKVPKLELVAAVTALLDGGRLAIPRAIPEAKTLAAELLAFKVKVTAAGNEKMEADWRSRAHDDLVLALAMAAYLGDSATAQLWLRQGGETFNLGGDPPPPGPRRTVLPDGTIIEESAGMGTQVTYPGSPARSGLDISPQAPGWVGRSLSGWRPGRCGW